MSALKNYKRKLVSVDLFGLKIKEENQLTTIIGFIHRYSGDGRTDDGNHDDHAYMIMSIARIKAHTLLESL